MEFILIVYTTTNNKILHIPFREYYSFLNFDLMYCDLCSQYMQVRKLFKGGHCSRAETIPGNTVYPQEVQEHRLFCSFAWKIKFLLLAHVGKKVKNFTGAHMCTQTQLNMNNLSPTNMPIIKNQVQLDALKV